MSLISYCLNKGFVVQKTVGNDVRMLGYKKVNGDVSIIPEEAVYLVETNKAYAYEAESAIEAHEKKAAPMSMARLLKIMTQCGVSVAKYKHYRRLVEDCIVRPFKELAGAHSISHHNLGPPKICWCPECPEIVPDYHVWEVKRDENGLRNRSSRNTFSNTVPPSYRFLVLDNRFSYNRPPLDRIADVSDKLPLLLGRGYSGVVFRVTDVYLYDDYGLSCEFE
uniref:tRNA_int_end_N2 domain-containing protein n=1 Tax=Panagrellus redivivus TaxID=6233 RepID=A0A7E4VV97_PANRE